MADRAEGLSLQLAESAIQPATAGLLAFGLTVFLLALHLTGLLPRQAMLLGLGVFYGGIAQIATGLLALRRGDAFSASAFAAFGLFCLSLVPLVFLPAAAFSRAPQPAAMAAYYGMWGVFAALHLPAVSRMNRALQATFVLLAVFLLLLAAAAAAASLPFRHLGACAGLLAGAAAVYAGLGRMVNETWGRSVLPLGTPKQD